MHARQLFDQIFLDGNIKTVARRRHQEHVTFALKYKSQTRQDLCNLACFHLYAQYTLHALCAQLDRKAQRQLATYFRDSACLATTDVEYQLCGAIQRSNGG